MTVPATNVATEEDELPELLGTAPQRSWAIEIRAKAIVHIDAWISERQRMIADFRQRDQFRGAAHKLSRELSKMIENYEWLKMTERRSWWWIENREISFLDYVREMKR